MNDTKTMPASKGNRRPYVSPRSRLPIAVPKQRNRSGLQLTRWIGLGLFSFWLLVAMFGPLLAPYPMGAFVSDQIYGGASTAHLLGTDYMGRDMLSRMLTGARYTVGLALVAALLSSLVGAGFGMLTVLLPRWLEESVRRIFDTLISIPSKMMALVMVSAFGTSIPLLILAAVLSYAPGSFRIAHSLAKNLSTLEYVQVAHTRGEGRLYIAAVEIFPNMIQPVLTDMGMRFVFIVLLLSGMSFLGLGVQPPAADLGSLVRENIGGLSQGALAVIAPALAIGSLTVGANLLIDSLSNSRDSQKE
ncbi:ABC transporter permease [Chromohalobacter nigrandesensis]|uniref:ABC transporter permease n=1 Tax=Chromohalobacter nigrandesensis TaxID=119863 RepID=UPI001FF6C630|nr:ABC transporter permease [Chromohalobacter nigrandesensis]MCK0744528.1 ABC transporter permease [Chromohalobacter nigrandesensis]